MSNERDPKRPHERRDVEHERIEKAHREYDRGLDESVTEDRQIIRDELPEVLPTETDEGE